MIVLLDLAVSAEPAFEQASGKVPEKVKKKCWRRMMDLQHM